jgi:hypothetical protein
MARQRRYLWGVVGLRCGGLLRVMRRRRWRQVADDRLRVLCEIHLFPGGLGQVDDRRSGELRRI